MTKFETRMRQGAKLRFGLAALIAVLVGALIVWPKYQEFTAKYAQVSELQTKINSVEAELEIERNQYRTLKGDYGLRATADQELIAAILPEEPEQTELVRQIEAEANRLAADGDFELKSVNFSRATQKDKEVDYTTLPFKINFTATKEKLMAFLRELEHTGSLNSGATGSRLLDVQDVSIQIRDRGSEGERQEISVDLTVNAYTLPALDENAKKTP